MTLTIDLPEDRMAALKAKAASAGLSLEAWFSQLVMETSAENLVELRVVATRPIEQNGLGMSSHAAAIELTRRIGGSLVTRHRGSGKPAHDARLVAALEVVHPDTVLAS
jgi:hypothetical protein